MEAQVTDPNAAYCSGNFVCPRDPTAPQRHELAAVLHSVGLPVEESDLGGGCIAVMVDSTRDGHWEISNAHDTELDTVWSAMYYSRKGDPVTYELPTTATPVEDVAMHFVDQVYGLQPNIPVENAEDVIAVDLNIIVYLDPEGMPPKGSQERKQILAEHIIDFIVNSIDGDEAELATFITGERLIERRDISLTSPQP